MKPADGACFNYGIGHNDKDHKFKVVENFM